MKNSELLKNILENPENDEYRLVYADWLMERGDIRGEFIRFQCELKQKSDNKAYQDQEKNLLKKYKKRWLEPFRDAKRARWTFDRGFIKELIIYAEHFVTLAGDIFTTEPVDRLQVWRTSSDNLEKVIHNNYLGRIRILCLRKNKIGAKGLQLFANTHAFDNLRELDISRANIGVRCASSLELLNPDGMPKLEHLDLNSNQIGDKGLIALVNSRLFPKLATLNMNYANIGNDGIQALCRAESNNLKNLHVSNNAIEDVALENIINSEKFQGLEKIDASLNKLEGSINCQQKLPSLKVLNLYGNTLGVVGVNSFFARSFSPNLEELLLVNCSLNDESIRLLSQLHLPKLKYIDLSSNHELSDKSADALVNADGFESLKKIIINKPNDWNSLTIKGYNMLEERYEIIDPYDEIYQTV